MLEMNSSQSYQSQEVSTPNGNATSTELKRRNSFSNVSPVNKTPDRPQMTSTPNSDSSHKSIRKNINDITRQTSEWQESPKANKTPTSNFKTAALKNQQQRWSLAEQSQVLNHLPINNQYGYIQSPHYPVQYGTLPHRHFPPYHPHQAHGLHSHGTLPHKPHSMQHSPSAYQGPNNYHNINSHPNLLQHPSNRQGRVFASYGPSASNSVYAGSQRSSISSLHGLYQGIVGSLLLSIIIIPLFQILGAVSRCRPSMRKTERALMASLSLDAIV